MVLENLYEYTNLDIIINSLSYYNYKCESLYVWTFVIQSCKIGLTDLDEIWCIDSLEPGLTFNTGTTFYPF